MHEREDEDGLRGECIGEFCISVTARETVVEEEVYFEKSTEETILWEEFF